MTVSSQHKGLVSLGILLVVILLVVILVVVVVVAGFDGEKLSRRDVSERHERHRPSLAFVFVVSVVDVGDGAVRILRSTHARSSVFEVLLRAHDVPAATARGAYSPSTFVNASARFAASFAPAAPP